MAVKIGGLSQKECQARWEISRGTLHNYRKRDDWPGDKADLGLLDQYVAYVRSNSGRKRKTSDQCPVTSKQTGTLPDDETFDDSNGVDETTQLMDALGLDREAKLTFIEKNKAMTYAYQQKALAEYRAEVQQQLFAVLEDIFQELKACELSTAQLANIKKAIDRIRQRLLLGKTRVETQQPELLLEVGEGVTSDQ